MSLVFHLFCLVVFFERVKLITQMPGSPLDKPQDCPLSLRWWMCIFSKCVAFFTNTQYNHHLFTINAVVSRFPIDKPNLKYRQANEHCHLQIHYASCIPTQNAYCTSIGISEDLKQKHDKMPSTSTPLGWLIASSSWHKATPFEQRRKSHHWMPFETR